MEKKILYREETGSTMSDAYDAVNSGLGHGTVCWSSFQRSGRGRVPGRKWNSEPGEALLMTMIFDAEYLNYSPTPSLRAGLGVAVYLEKLLQTGLMIKWPNDIILEGKKICGILSEFRLGKIFVGIGLNLNQNGFPGSLPSAGSLRQFTGKTYSAGDMVIPLAESVEAAVVRKNTNIEEFNRRLYRRGSEISLTEGDPSRNKVVTGVARGLNPDGSLMVEIERTGLNKGRKSGKKSEYTEIKTFYSGELKIWKNFT